MANQFDSAIRFHAVAWRAFDKRTRASLLVIDRGDEAAWTVSAPRSPSFPAGVERGTSPTPTAARAKVRRIVEKLPTAKGGHDGGQD